MSDEKDLNVNTDEQDIDIQQDSIEQILKDFQNQKERKETGGELEPPKIYSRTPIDFAREDTADDASEKNAERARKRFAIPKLKIKKTNINYKKLLKAVGIAVAAVVVISAVICGIIYGVNQSKSAYLKPYEKKYPDVEFPVGIMEKYCDIYGANPTAVGYIKISEIRLNAPVLSEEKAAYPYAEENTSDYNQFNYVVYLQDGSLEKYYGSAEAYNNNATGYISYSDLYNEYRFKVVGAFYTNTKAEDDNGYIFPYNVTEEMTVDSSKQFFERLENRFIYSVGMTLTRQDKLLTISCPTDYRENFRFVVVGVLRNDSTEKPTAEDKSSVHYPQVIYNELKQDNPYKFASQWYPEIQKTNSKGDIQTEKQTRKDYE